MVVYTYTEGCLVACSIVVSSDDAHHDDNGYDNHKKSCSYAGANDDVQRVVFSLCDRCCPENIKTQR